MLWEDKYQRTSSTAAINQKCRNWQKAKEWKNSMERDVYTWHLPSTGTLRLFSSARFFAFPSVRSACHLLRANSVQNHIDIVRKHICSLNAVFFNRCGGFLWWMSSPFPFECNALSPAECTAVGLHPIVSTQPNWPIKREILSLWMVNFSSYFDCVAVRKCILAVLYLGYLGYKIHFVLTVFGCQYLAGAGWTTHDAKRAEKPKRVLSRALLLACAHPFASFVWNENSVES